MDMFDLASTLFGGRGNPVAQGSSLTATGSTASEDGTAYLVMDADVTPAEGVGDDTDQTVIDVPTSPSVAEGDEVIMTLVGDGPLKTPLVMANPGFGDRMQVQVDNAETLATEAQEVAQATGQHFWPDDDGVHVTEVTQEDWSDSTSPDYHSGANVLLNALGQLFRDGLNNILAIVSGSDPGVAIYDGEGNAADNILALLTKSLIRLGGRFAASGRSTAKVQFFEDDSALTDLTAEHYIDTTTEPQVSHDLALSSTVTDDELPNGTSRTVTGNVEVWEQIYNDGSTYSDEVTASLNGATTNRQYNASMGVRVIEASGGQVERTAFAVADNLRLTHGTGSQATTADVPMEQAIAVLSSPVTLFTGTYSQTVSSTVTLSETAANFSRMLIEWETGDGNQGSTMLSDPNGKRFECVAVNCGANTNPITYIKWKVFRVNGTQISNYSVGGTQAQLQRGEIALRNNGSVTTTRNEYIGIIRVLGWR